MAAKKKRIRTKATKAKAAPTASAPHEYPDDLAAEESLRYPVTALRSVCHAFAHDATKDGKRDDGMVAAARVAVALYHLIQDGQLERLDEKNGMHAWARAYLRAREANGSAAIGFEEDRVTRSLDDGSSDPLPDDPVDFVRAMIGRGDAIVAKGLSSARFRELAFVLLDTIDEAKVFDPCREADVRPFVEAYPSGVAVPHTGLVDRLKRASKREKFAGASAARQALIHYFGGDKAAQKKADNAIEGATRLGSDAVR